MIVPLQAKSLPSLLPLLTIKHFYRPRTKRHVKIVSRFSPGPSTSPPCVGWDPTCDGLSSQAALYAVDMSSPITLLAGGFVTNAGGILYSGAHYAVPHAVWLLSYYATLLAYPEFEHLIISQRPGIVLPFINSLIGQKLIHDMWSVHLAISLKAKPRDLEGFRT